MNLTPSYALSRQPLTDQPPVIEPGASRVKKPSTSRTHLRVRYASLKVGGSR
jgi:hypothetical protein